MTIAPPTCDELREQLAKVTRERDEALSIARDRTTLVHELELENAHLGGLVAILRARLKGGDR